MGARGIGLIILFPVLFQYCAPARFVKPLEKGKKALAFSFGGPLIKYSGAAIPIPFSTLAGGYGLAEHCTLFAGIHTTSLVFGNLQADVGATFGLPFKNKTWGMSVSPALQAALAAGKKGTVRVWPSADLNWYKHFSGRMSFLYAGVNSWFELAGSRSDGLTQQRHLIPNLQAGYVFVKSKWDHQLEFKYLGAGIPNLPNVVEYIGAGGMGSFGIYYSVIRKF